MPASVSAWFLAEPTSEVEHVCHVAIWRGGAPVLNVEGEPLVLDPVDGSVIEDRSADTQLTLSATFAPTDDVGTNLIPEPGDTNAPLSHYGFEARVFMGYRWVDLNPETGSRVETTPMGRFRITSFLVQEDDAGAPVVQISGSDGSWLVRRPPARAYRVPGGTELGAAFRAIVHGKDPTAAVYETASEFPIGSSVVVGLRDSPWAKAKAVAQAAGCEAFYDRRDRAVMSPTIETGADGPVFSFVEGETATFVAASRGSNAEENPNVVTIIGTSGGGSGTVMATAADTDPGSPTNVMTQGEITKIIESPLIDNQTQAQQAANAELRRALRTHDAVEFTAGRNAALTVRDPIAVTRARLGMHNRRTVVDRIEFPLVVPIMRVRAQRIPTTSGEIAA